MAGNNNNNKFSYVQATWTSTYQAVTNVSRFIQIVFLTVHTIKLKCLYLNYVFVFQNKYFRIMSWVMYGATHSQDPLDYKNRCQSIFCECVWKERSKFTHSCQSWDTKEDSICENGDELLFLKNRLQGLLTVLYKFSRSHRGFLKKKKNNNFTKVWRLLRPWPAFTIL